MKNPKKKKAKKTRVLPIKFTEDMYQDLKTVSVSEGIPMAEVVRNYLGPGLKTSKTQKQIEHDHKLLDQMAGSLEQPEHLKGRDLDEIIDEAKEIYFKKYYTFT